MAEPVKDKPPIPPHDHRYKVVLVGDPGVGKTSLLLQYTENRFPEEGVTNVGVDYKTKLIDIDGKTVYLEIWDTAGQERFRTISASFYKGAHGIILVYDVADEETYNNLATWLPEIDRNVAEDSCVQRVLVGNKTDLVSGPTKTQNRTVKSTTAEELAKKVEMDYQETSAKENTNVEGLFTALVREMIKSGQAGKDSTGVIQITSTTHRSKKSKDGGCCSKS